MLPVENSTAGSVTQVYDLMRKHSFYITKATKVLVRHNLLTAAESTLDEVTDIYSHPQACLLYTSMQFLQNFQVDSLPDGEAIRVNAAVSPVQEAMAVAISKPS